MSSVANIPAGVPFVDLEREEIEDARLISIKRKLEIGGELFDDLAERIMWIIRREMPDKGPEAHLMELERRFERAREMENW